MQGIPRPLCRTLTALGLNLLASTQSGSLRRPAISRHFHQALRTGHQGPLGLCLAGTNDSPVVAPQERVAQENRQRTLTPQALGKQAASRLPPPEAAAPTLRTPAPSLTTEPPRGGRTVRRASDTKAGSEPSGDAGNDKERGIRPGTGTRRPLRLVASARRGLLAERDDGGSTEPPDSALLAKVRLSRCLHTMNNLPQAPRT